MIFRTYYTSTTAMLTNAIIESEDLDLVWAKVVNALGDTMIEVSGSKEDVGIFKAIFTMCMN